MNADTGVIRKPLFLAFILFLALGAACAGEGAKLAVVDCTLIDGTGAKPVSDAAVLVKDGIIRYAGAKSAAGDLGSYPVVSLHGAFLLPGFINAHVHSAYNESNLRYWLTKGVTTVRDMGYTDSLENVKKRDALGAERFNTRIVAGTPLITHSGGYGASFVDGADSARKAVKKYLRAGFDFIKLAFEDNLQGRTWPMLTSDELRAAAAEAHGAGKRVSVHVSHVRNLQPLIDAGADDLAHMVVEPLGPELANTIAGKGIAWVPTLELWKGVAGRYGLDWEDVAVRNTGVFFKAGGKIALGTDYNGYTTDFDDGFPITEARLLLEAGLSPMDVIVAGTRNAADVCGRAKDLGTVAKGKIADLFAVARNPLEDITALLEPVQVFKSGVPVLPGLESAEAGDDADGPAAPGIPPDTGARLDALIRRLMKEQQVPGLSLAVTDGERTLWSGNYGWTGRDRKQAVTDGTMFGVQSLSETVTATLVMLACRDGLVDLDTPVTEYLPGFTVNSVFESHPERLITLRRLLNHTSGFPAEAPFGNNMSLGQIDFRKHIESISETWLRFPVGKNWAYSNLGIDLAGYILEKRSGMPFARYAEEKLFMPLGMSRTTFDPERIRADTDRAKGHGNFFTSIPVDVPMIPAAGLYASAGDLVKFVRLHLSGGGGLVEAERFRGMYALSGDGVTGSFGLGIARLLVGYQGHPLSYGFDAFGGGFGFLAGMVWYPETGVGAVLLTNSGDHRFLGDLLLEVLNSVMDDPRTVFHERLRDLEENDPETVLPQRDVTEALRADNATRFEQMAIDPISTSDSSREPYRGEYRTRNWGQPTELVSVKASRNGLSLNGSKLYESSPGLFFNADGEALDFRSAVPTWRTIPLEKTGIPLLRWVLEVLFLAVFPAGLLAAPVLIFLKRRRGQAAASSGLTADRFLSGIGTVLALANAAAVTLLMLILTRFFYLLGNGLPPATPGVPPFERMLLLMPVIALVLTLSMTGVCAYAWVRRRWSGAGRLYYSVLSGGAAAFVALAFLTIG